MSRLITPRIEDYSKWYTDVVIQAKLADYSPVKGCMVIRPHGYALWENIQKVLDPFSDLENSSELNLGLTVSVQMIRDIGGTIRIESGKQSGNKVIIDIPKSLASEKKLDEEIASLG